MWSVVHQESSLDTQCPGLLLGAGCVGTVCLAGIHHCLCSLGTGSHSEQFWSGEDPPEIQVSRCQLRANLGRGHFWDRSLRPAVVTLFYTVTLSWVPPLSPLAPRDHTASGFWHLEILKHLPQILALSYYPPHALHLPPPKVLITEMSMRYPSISVPTFIHLHIQFEFLSLLHVSNTLQHICTLKSPSAKIDSIIGINVSSLGF